LSISLRPLGDDAIPPLFELLQNEDLYRYLTVPPPRSLDELALRLEVDVRPEGHVFTVHRVEKPEEPIGFCRYRIEGPNKYEIGYKIGCDFWGQGYATCVVTALLKELAIRFGVGVVFASADIGNVASIRALERNGFLYSGFSKTLLKCEGSFNLEYARPL
jgi:RimJ/RimL family protein N-acetyltransferase